MRGLVFYIPELTEVIMVNKDKDFVLFAAFQVIIPSIKAFNNSQKLLILIFVISLTKDHLLRKWGYEMPSTSFR